MKTQWHPANDQILVRPCIVSDRTTSGLILPDNAQERERPLKGIVLAVGAGMVNQETGLLIPISTQEGDLIAFGKYGGIEWKDRGESFLLIRENEILLRARAHGYVLIDHVLERATGAVTVSHESDERCEHCPRETSPVLLEERERLIKER